MAKHNWYTAVRLEERGSEVYVVNGWPIRVGISAGFLEGPPEQRPYMRQTDDGRNLYIHVANGWAHYERVGEDCEVWVGRLVTMEYEPPTWVQEVA